MPSEIVERLQGVGDEVECDSLSAFARRSLGDRAARLPAEAAKRPPARQAHGKCGPRPRSTLTLARDWPYRGISGGRPPAVREVPTRMEPKEGESSLAYEFGDFRFVPARQMLLRRGQPVRLGARALDLLHALVERPGELLDKSTLMRRAWPDTFVHDANLKVNMASVRRALSVPGETSPVATVTGRGYRFVAPVHTWPLALSTRATEQAPRQLPRPPVTVGRQTDLLRVAERLVGGRLVTIVGPAGVGKTTLALLAGHEFAARFPDGACFVDLAAITDARLVATTIATAAGVAGGVTDLLAGVVARLAGKRQLLVLDNCEHVLGAVAFAAAQLHAALPELSLLATSREPLRVSTERVYRLAPLRTPAASAGLTRQEALRYSAIALFAWRAREAAGYELTDADAPVVAEVCRRLDGIALAIELAAPRLQGCDPHELLRRLETNFDLLSHGRRDRPVRQQALLATLDWSYHLLTDDEADLFRRLSIFAGAFSVEDALGVTRQLGLADEDVASGVEALAAKSLLSREWGGERMRFRLLDATRSYADGRLRSAGEHAKVAEAHLAWLLQTFEQAEAEWRWRRAGDWLARYGRLANDLRKALDSIPPGPAAQTTGIQLTAAAIPLWGELSSVGEGRARVTAALAVADALSLDAPELRLKLTTALALSLTFAERLTDEAEDACREALRLARHTGEPDYQLRALWGLGVLQSFRGRHREALASLDSFQSIAEAARDGSALVAGRRFRLMTQFYLGDLATAHAGLLQLAGANRLDAQRTRMSHFQVDRAVVIRVSLAVTSWMRGEFSVARRTAREAVEGAAVIGHGVSQANALALASIPVALWSGDLGEAERGVATLVEHLNRRELALWAPLARFFQSAIEQARGDADALGRMTEALEAVFASELLFRAPAYLGMVADAAFGSGRIDVARTSVQEAFDRAAASGEAWFAPEHARLQAGLRRAEGNETAAEAALRRAIRDARRMGAPAFELRAVSDLSDLMTCQGRTVAALEELSPVVDSFATEPAVRDLARARTLRRRLETSAGARSPASA